MTDMGALEHFLNVRVTRSCSHIQIDQSVYTQKVLDTFRVHLGTETKVRKCPRPSDTMDRIAKEPKECSEEDQRYVDNFPYRSMLGALLYLSMNTRPDIAYAVGLLSRFGSKVTCMLMVYLLQYIRGTVQMGIRFSGSRFDMHVFTDADWAGDVLTRPSTTGYVVFAAGGPLAWGSQLQATVATSSMQSEYQGMYAGMQVTVWFRGVLSEISLPLCEPTPFFLDSQSAEDLAMKPVYHERSKHIEIKYHWIREHVDPEGEHRTATLIQMKTADQPADIFTKALTGPVFESHRKKVLGQQRKASASVTGDNRRKRPR